MAKSYAFLKMVIKTDLFCEKWIFGLICKIGKNLIVDHDKLRIRQSVQLRNCSFMSILGASQISDLLD